MDADGLASTLSTCGDVDSDAEDDIDYGRLDQDDDEQVDSNGRSTADYFKFCVALETAAHIAETEARQSKGGRPVTKDVDLDAFSFMVIEGATEAELCSTFGCDRNRVNYLKRQLGMNGLRAHCGKRIAAGDGIGLPSAEELEARWTDDRGFDSLHRLPVSKAITLLAAELGIGVNALRRHGVSL